MQHRQKLIDWSFQNLKPQEQQWLELFRPLDEWLWQEALLLPWLTVGPQGAGVVNFVRHIWCTTQEKKLSKEVYFLKALIAQNIPMQEDEISAMEQGVFAAQKLVQAIAIPVQAQWDEYEQKKGWLWAPQQLGQGCVVSTLPLYMQNYYQWMQEHEFFVPNNTNEAKLEHECFRFWSRWEQCQIQSAIDPHDNGVKMDQARRL